MKIPAKVFAVVVTYNGEETLAECLDWLEKSEYPIQTIVVENTSTDDTPNIIQKYSNLIYLPQPRNIGPGQANNIGMRYAIDQEADYVILLNQDAIINEKTVGNLISISEQYPEYGILSPLQLNKDASGFDHNVLTYLNKFNGDYINDLLFKRIRDHYTTTFMPGAAWLMTRKCIETVGGFDPLFFIYGEDDDYVDRMQRHGLEIGIVTDSTILHKRTGMRPKTSRLKNIKQKAAYESTYIKASIKKSKKPFLQTVILWRIDHCAKKMALFVKRDFVGLLIQLLAGTNVLVNLPKVWKHKQLSTHKPAFWNDQGSQAPLSS